MMRRWKRKDCMRLRAWPTRQQRHLVLRARYYSRAFQRPLKHTWSARRAQSAQPVPAAKGRKALPRSWQSANPILRGFCNRAGFETEADSFLVRAVQEATQSFVDQRGVLATSRN